MDGLWRGREQPRGRDERFGQCFPLLAGQGRRVVAVRGLVVRLELGDGELVHRDPHWARPGGSGRANNDCVLQVLGEELEVVAYLVGLAALVIVIGPHVDALRPGVVAVCRVHR